MKGIKMNDEVKKSEDVSVMRQLDSLTSEVNKLAESLEVMGNRLIPLLPLLDDKLSTGKEEYEVIEVKQESPMMDIAVHLTSRIRMLNREVCNVMENVQI
jgi:hypothetical protein